ncbi:MAG: flippase [Thermoplasmatales archaeon]|nr:flippase [Thermoplasmatales archaeon]
MIGEKSIARKSALIVLMQLTNAFLGYVALKFIAVYMQPWEYGIIGFAYGFISIFSIFGDLGFNSAHIKRISEGKDIEKCISTFALTKIFLSFSMVFLVFLTIELWKINGRGFESDLHEKALYIILCSFILSVLAQIFTVTFNAKKEIAKNQIPNFASTLSRCIATIFVAYYGLGVMLLSYTYLIGSIFEFLTAISLFNYKFGKWSREYFKYYYSFAIPVAIGSASSLIIMNFDRVAIQIFYGAEEVGQYFAVSNLSRFLVLFISAVTSLLFPITSELYSKNNLEEMKRVTKISERYLSMIVFPIVVTMIALSQAVIHILISDQYMPAIMVLQIFPIFLILEALSMPYSTMLSGMNMPKYERNRLAIIAFLNVLLNIILLPRIGLAGGAVAIVFSYLAGLIYIRFIAFRVAKTGGSYRIALHAISSLISYFLLTYVLRFFTVARWYHLLAFSFLGFIIYFFVLFILREFKKEDFVFFADALNPMKMIGYVKDEIKNK